MFAQKASSNIKELSWVSNFLNITMFSAVILYIATLCYGLAHLKNPVNCRNVSFLVTEIINLAISIMFLGIGYQIDKNARSQVQDRLKQAQADFEFSSEKSAK